MYQPIGKPGQVLDLRRIEPGEQASQKRFLVRTADMEIIQFIIPADEGIPTYEALGELVVVCLEGRIVLSVQETERELSSGQLLYLSTNEPFSIRGVEDASLLVTIITAKRGQPIESIGD